MSPEYGFTRGGALSPDNKYVLDLCTILVKNRILPVGSLITSGLG
jgi:hypothetical protein